MQEKLKVEKQNFISELSKIVKSHRIKLKKNIYSISAEASTPRSTWRDLEFGISKNINLSTFCKIAEGLEMKPWELLKELCDKLGEEYSFSDFD